jgi:hypothetical protein
MQITDITPLRKSGARLRPDVGRLLAEEDRAARRRQLIVDQIGKCRRLADEAMRLAARHEAVAVELERGLAAVNGARRLNGHD